MKAPSHYQSVAIIYAEANGGSDATVQAHIDYTTVEGDRVSESGEYTLTNGVENSADIQFSIPPGATINVLIISMDQQNPVYVSLYLQYQKDGYTYNIPITAGWIRADISNVFKSVGYIEGVIIEPLKTAGYYFNGSVAQVVGVPTPIGVKFTVALGAEMHLMEVHIKAGTYGAARDIILKHKDSSGNQISNLMSDALTTGQINEGIHGRHIASTVTSNTPSSIGAPQSPLVIHSQETFEIEGLSLADTEVITVRVKALISGDIPTVAAIGSGITLTTTTVKVV